MRSAVLPCLLAAGCIQLQFVRDRRAEPLPAGAEAGLAAGKSDLGACLAALGAPHSVGAAPGGGVWAVWAWSDEGGWLINVSLPVLGLLSGSFTWDSTTADVRGIVVLLDRDLVVREVRRGRLSVIFSGGMDAGGRRRRRRS